MRTTYGMVKAGKRIVAVLETQGGHGWRECPEYDPIGVDRVFSVDTESLRTKHSPLSTVLVSIGWHDGEQAIEPPKGRGMLERLCAVIVARYGVPAHEPSATVQRPRMRRPGSSRTRDGRRLTVDPCVAVFFNLKYDLGRLLDDRPGILRAVVVGADSYRVDVSARYEIEVSRMHLGNGASFEWYVRDRVKNTIARVIGIDLTGYWKTSLKKAAAAAGVTLKQEIDRDWFKRPRESFTDDEWGLFVDYGLGDVRTTRELYHATAALLSDIDRRVFRRSGVIPPSAPGASARIAFALAFDCHPELRKDEGGDGFWPRPPESVDRIGLDAYRGARVFCVRPGRRKALASFDIRSAYPAALAMLPDPVSADYAYVKPKRPDAPFRVEEWRGVWGALCIDGEETDDLYPALRVHDLEHNRLRGVVGRFEKVTATIPEIVVGVLSGGLKVTRVRYGCVVRGTAETSFLRAAVTRYFAIKNDPSNAKALRDMAKLLANSLYGKLIEVQVREYSIAEDAPVPEFTHPGVAKTIARIYATGGDVDRRDDYFAGGQRARELYRAELAKIPGNDEERAGKAVLAYVEAISGSAQTTGKVERLGDYMRKRSTYRCGQFFLPMHAALTTGLTSAIVGLAARCTRALQGDTDSIHVELPVGVRCKKGQAAADVGIPGWDRFERLLRESGFAPNVPGLPELGRFFCEAPPSSESILVRPKVYSHRVDGAKHGPEYKQAKHGFTAYDEPDPPHRPGFTVETWRTYVGEHPELRGRRYHALLAQLVRDGSANYTPRARPRQLREAVYHSKPVGEFTTPDDGVTAVLAPDPNTWKDARGFVRWLCMDGRRLRSGPPLKKTTTRAATGPPTHQRAGP